MANPKRRHSKARRNRRRSHDALKGPTVSADPVTGEIHRRHHITAEGFYRGRKVLDLPEPEETEE